MKRFVMCGVICAFLASLALLASKDAKSDVKDTRDAKGIVVKPSIAVVSGRVGYVSSASVVNDSKIGKQIKGELGNKLEDSNKEVQAREQEVSKTLAAYKTKESTLTDSAREGEQAKLMRMRRELDAIVQEKEEDFKRLQQKANDRLTKEALETAAELARAEGLDAVVDIDSGKALYVASGANHTSAFVELINKHFDAEEEAKKKQHEKPVEKPAVAKKEAAAK